jgi:cellulose synthase/poly-beta-1,6-N-acetylglucosamine synthase-like glycosyltransferase
MPIFSEILYIVWIIFQVLIGIHLIIPLLLYIFHFFTKKNFTATESTSVFDYAIIVTAYQQTTLLPSVVDSILKLNYDNYLIYIVADNCDISNLHFESDKVVLLRPEEVLAGNIKSHFYAINHFKRPHELLTIIDSDNLVDPEYLNELNKFFDQNFIAVQGVRAAKNLDTSYACLDETGDMYYRFIDRKLLFSVGSSASLAGSGMAFTTAFYKECLESKNIDGAGFDKVLLMEILYKDKQVAFAEKAVVYDEKTSKPDQLVKQRARWLSAWFKYAYRGIILIKKSILKPNWNQFLCGLMFSRPPLFILIFLSGFCILIDLFLQPVMLWFWAFGVFAFIYIFFAALNYFRAPKVIYDSLIRIPYFVFYQVLALFKAKNADKISTATVHHYKKNIDE